MVQKWDKTRPEVGESVMTWVANTAGVHVFRRGRVTQEEPGFAAVRCACDLFELGKG